MVINISLWTVSCEVHNYLMNYLLCKFQKNQRFIDASYNGDLSKVKQLLDAGADINATGGRYVSYICTTIHYFRLVI